MREGQIQVEVFNHLRQRPNGDVFAFHPKNDGSRRGGLGAAGIIAGVPDIIAIKDGKTYGLELKADKGIVSPAQAEVLKTMQAAGATVAVTYGLDRALHVLEQWGLLKGHSA